jgi:hypothetical protein
MRAVKKPQKELKEINTLNVIINGVLHYYDLSFDDLEKSSKEPIYAEPRHIAMALCYSFTKNNQSLIGQYFGGRNHATVNHAMRKVVNLSAVDREYKNVVNKIIAYANFELSRSFKLQDVIDTLTGVKTKSSYSDNLIESFNELTKELMETEEQESMLNIVAKMKEVNGLIWSREVQSEVKSRIGINVSKHE